MVKKFLIFIFLVALVSVVAIQFKPKSLDDKKDILLLQLAQNIKEAEAEGVYHCCIEPACTMCYLGSWIFDEGTCNCDAMIAAGEWDKVCPQCQRGIEEGYCKSGSEKACDIESGDIFKEA